ncbi:MAG: pyruvate formate lyase family protein [Thermodesulfobacteriota bacterium]|nr:pyruvate formate lyase family protein [Thermodesulfobacteriota bacterium]
MDRTKGGEKMTEATKKLKESIIYKSYVSKKKDGAPATQEFRKGPRICFERGRLITESYRETEGEPEVIRRAKALEKILDEMTVYIRDGERIVGNYASDPSAYNIFPELAVNWLNKSINNGYGSMVDDKGKEEWQEIYDYWHDRSIDGRVMPMMPEPLKGYVDFNGVSHMNHWRDYITPLEPNYKTVFTIGLRGVIDKIDKRLHELKAEIKIHPKDYVSQRNFLEAAKISCEAVVRFSKRYAHKARELRENEKDPRRLEELEQIIEACSHVPENPPRSLYEAVQGFWIIYVINRFIETHGQGLGQRFDQLMYPFYERDKSEGRITYESAQELVEYLFVKMEECGHLVIPELHTGGVGVSIFQTFTIGGLDAYGRDASNEFSFIILDAAIAMNTIHTNIAFRYHPDINRDLVKKAIDCSGTGIGYPAYFNDHTMMNLLTQRGIPRQDAMDYSILGCVALTVPGKCMKQSPATGGAVSLGKCLELALNQGKDMLRGTQLGCKTQDPGSFQSYDDVINAYLSQFRYVAERVTAVDNLAHHFFVQYMQRPFTSALVDGCIDRGQDSIEWAYHSLNLLLTAGNTNVADSLAAIKKFVFEDKALTMTELVEALKFNFEGEEELRQRLLNEAPKFGNDDDCVDQIMADVEMLTQKELEGLEDYYGYPWSLDGSIAGGYFPWGRRAAASADGRKAKETFADAVASPMHGKDRHGPTAVLKSLGKVTPTWSHLTNQKFLPQFLKGENQDLFAGYLKTWSDLGCSHIQFNVVDRETLLDAQARPEKHPYLAVRVAGYSAYFADLSKGVQDDILARVGQSF